MNAIVTVIGKDKVGIIAAVCIKLGDNPVPALADVNVRTAMQYAIDSDAISQYQGYTYANDNDKNVSLFYKGLAIYNPDVPSSGSWGRGWNCPSASSGKKFSMPCTEYKERERC